jgi:hypothetical protein
VAKADEHHNAAASPEPCVPDRSQVHFHIIYRLRVYLSGVSDRSARQWPLVKGSKASVVRRVTREIRSGHLASATHTAILPTLPPQAPECVLYNLSHSSIRPSIFRARTLGRESYMKGNKLQSAVLVVRLSAYSQEHKQKNSDAKALGISDSLSR